MSSFRDVTTVFVSLWMCVRVKLQHFTSSNIFHSVVIWALWNGDPFSYPVLTGFRRIGVIWMEIFGIHPFPSSRRVCLLRWSKKIASHKRDFVPLLLDRSYGWWMRFRAIRRAMSVSTQIACLIFKRYAIWCKERRNRPKQLFKQRRVTTSRVARMSTFLPLFP